MGSFGQDSSVNPWLPGHIVSSSEPLSYTVQLPDGRTFRRQIDHIHKCTRFHSELEHKQVTASEFPEVVEPEEAEVILPVPLTLHHKQQRNNRQLSRTHSPPKL